MKKSAKLEAAEELRGFVFKIYPTQEQTKLFFRMQTECRLIWNYLVEQNEAYTDRCIQKTVDDGVIAPLPDRPTPSSSREERHAYFKARLQAQFAASKHCRQFEDYKWPALTMRADCYGPLRERCEAELGSPLKGNISMTRAVIARFLAARVPKKGGNWRRPRYKKERAPWVEYGMLQVRDGARFVSGTFGPRGWHDHQLKFSGLVLNCRAGRAMTSGRRVEGASITRKADGWYGAVRVAASPRAMLQPTRGVIGLCFGLENLVTTSDGKSWVNPRGNEYSKLSAWMAEKAAECEKEGAPNDAWDWTARKNRYQLKMQRRTKQLIYAEILKSLADNEQIVIGTMTREDVQGPQCAMDENDDGGYTSACGFLRSMLKQRFGDRLVEVDISGVSDSDGVGTARRVLAKYWDLRGG